MVFFGAKIELILQLIEIIWRQERKGFPYNFRTEGCKKDRKPLELLRIWYPPQYFKLVKMSYFRILLQKRHLTDFSNPYWNETFSKDS